MSRRVPVQASAAAATHTKVTKNWFRWYANSRRRIHWPRPAPTNAPIMSYGPPPSRNTKAAQARAEARPENHGLYSGLRRSIRSSRSCACRTVIPPLAFSSSERSLKCSAYSLGTRFLRFVLLAAGLSAVAPFAAAPSAPASAFAAFADSTDSLESPVNTSASS